MERFPNCRKPNAMVWRKRPSAWGRSPVAREAFADSKRRCRASPGLSAAKMTCARMAKIWMAKTNRLNKLPGGMNEDRTRCVIRPMESARVRKGLIMRTSQNPPESAGTYGNGSPRRRQGFSFAYARPLHNRINGVRSNILQGFDHAVRPANFDGVHFRGGAQAKVQTQIILREIACAAANLAELLDATSANGRTRTDRCAIALGAHEVKQNPVKIVAISIQKNRRRFSDVEQNDIDVPVVKNVAESCAAPGFQGNALQAGFF